MNDEVRLSRQRVTRRRALALGGAVSLGGLLAACGGSEGDAPANRGAETGASTSNTPPPANSSVEELLAKAPNCTMAPEQTQGPYWFDVDSIRDDIREKRPGARLDLALRVQDLSACKEGGDRAPVRNAVVELWHCDAGGVYSGFESGSTGGPGGPPPGGSGETSDGSYSVGDQEATPSDDSTFLRGAQPTGRDGIARFTTIYPGWYPGRTVHIHVKVHVDKETVLTSQIYFDEKVNAKVFTSSPYDERSGRETLNDGDSLYDESGLVSVVKADDGYLGAINLGIS
jgi:protocatechuate 3,4-dioxygenase beta subunit